jgi:hypothetical protein
MSKQLYVGHEVLKPIITIGKLEKNIKKLQSKMQKIEISGPIGDQLREFYSRKIDAQDSMLSWYKQVTKV